MHFLQNIKLFYFSVIFNACVNDETMKDFCSSYYKRNLMKQPENPPCIDLISVSKPRSFHRTCVIKTGLSDFHIMTVSVLKIHLHKLPPKFISYRDIKSLKIKG